jgi:hypothetical protein
MVIAVISASGCGSPFNDRPFSKQAWAGATAEQRAAMAEDLVSNHVSPGASSKQIVSLLGEPGEVWVKGTGFEVKGERTFVYYIGSWSMQGMDDAFVCIHLDETGSVIEAEISGF